MVFRGCSMMVKGHVVCFLRKDIKYVETVMLSRTVSSWSSQVPHRFIQPFFLPTDLADVTSTCQVSSLVSRLGQEEGGGKGRRTNLLFITFFLPLCIYKFTFPCVDNSMQSERQDGEGMETVTVYTQSTQQDGGCGRCAIHT